MAATTPTSWADLFLVDAHGATPSPTFPDIVVAAPDFALMVAGKIDRLLDVLSAVSCWVASPRPPAPSGPSLPEGD